MVKKFKKKLKRIIKKLSYLFSKKIPYAYPILEGDLLKNRCALITGGSSGIGYCIAKSFLQHGSSVIIIGRDVKKLEEATQTLEAYVNGNQFIKYYELDLSNTNSINDAFNKIISENNQKIDILVNNAGVNKGSPIGQTNVIDFEKTFKTNLEGTYFLTQIVYNYMIKEKIRGNILNIASSSSLRPANTPYCLSKWAILGFTKGLAKKAIEHGIVVNAVAPGPTATPMLKDIDDKDINLLQSPIGRYIMPEEVANIAIILVSDLGKCIVGDTVYITGGAGVITYDDIEY